VHDTATEVATLLFTGNFEYTPNVDAALYLVNTLMPAVRSQLPEAKLWLVGNAPPPELQALANDHILVTGHVPDMLPYLQQATAFIAPLRLGAGIKNKVLEALALGCPVVATPLSVDGIAVQDERDVLVSEQKRLPETVIRLLRDEALRHKLARNGRALIEVEYTWDRIAQMYEDLYQSVVDQVEC
jgi:glycosyltransferase involved in cell wall biosynthesis